MELNKLEDSSSRYLRLHASNPVNWFPWGAEALELARYQDKPILLSIGYSACHWCHVMMQESFMDADVSATMNRLFINIKVDKEERPDLDKIYQTAFQLLMGQTGGWPLTMFLSPHTLIPYYGGTYFPKQADMENNIPDFMSLLHKLNDVYYHEKEKIQKQENTIKAVLRVISLAKPSSEQPLAAELKEQAVTSLQREFDPVNGGFGDDAKFPNCPTLEFLLHSKDQLTRHIALTTLHHMAESGLYDQLGGGFFRYTVDREWHIPHFEKMLYDNGQLIGLYAQAFKLTNNQLYRKIAMETAEWLNNHMQNANGSFYASIDADSDEQEGEFYVWDLKELKDALTRTEFAEIEKYYNLNHKPNFEHKKWHLYINKDANAPTDAQLTVIKQKLLKVRAQRNTPEIDKKIIPAWNGLTINGLVKVGLFNLAEKAIDDIEKAEFKFLDDYAFVLDGVLSLVGNDKNHKYMPFCQKLANEMLSNFFDHEQGGFFFTANSAESLFYRPKTFTDDAIPSGNGLACISLLKLHKLIGDEAYLDAVKKTLNCAQSYLNEAPELHTSMLGAYELFHVIKT